jgi:hypothetical protein
MGLLADVSLSPECVYYRIDLEKPKISKRYTVLTMSCPNLGLWVEMVSLILAISKLQWLLSISTNSRGVVSRDFLMKAYCDLKFYSSRV